ncbi:uroporphyrinogen decarboxylase family protein [Candidatus Hydrogenedentota bacterium]
MTSRERVRAAITFQGPDRLPIRHSVLTGARIKYGKELEDLLAEYEADVVSGMGRKMPVEELECDDGRRYRDHWGTVWHEATGEWLGLPEEHPLADLSKLDNFEWPDPVEDGNWDEVAANIAADNHKHYIIGDLGTGGTFFQLYNQIRGFEDSLCDLIIEDPRVEHILDRLMEYLIKEIRKWGELGIDAVNWGDDWGTQQQLMIAPELWLKYFRPRYEKMFDVAREYDMLLHFHSDGNVTEIIPFLVDMGVNVINIQLPIMDLPYLGEQLKGRVTVRGGMDRQQALPFGTPEDVRQNVREVFSTFGSSAGGWIGNGEIGPDVPLENARAMFEEIRACM